MAKQFTPKPKTIPVETEEEQLRRLLKDNYGKNPDAEAELGKPVTKLEAMLLLEDVLCDLSIVYALIDMLVDKGIIEEKELMQRFEKAREQNEV